MQHGKAKAFIVRDGPSQIIVSPEAQNLQGGLVEDARRHCAGELILLQDEELKQGQAVAEPPVTQGGAYAPPSRREIACRARLPRPAGGPLPACPT